MKELNPKRIKDRIMQIAHDKKAGHAASAMSCVNLLCDVYNKWPDAIVILSKAHAALALYVVLNELGKLPDHALASYYTDGGLSGHATLNKKYGINASCGSLGHGLPIGIGYAIANPDKIVVVVMGDGELEEGSTLEALQVINRLELKNILPIVDKNDFQGFKENEGMTEPKYRLYYSVKGEGFGEQYEGKMISHYQNVTDEVLAEWQRNSPKIEAARLKTLQEYKKKLLSQNNAKK